MARFETAQPASPTDPASADFEVREDQMAQLVLSDSPETSSESASALAAN